ncbi:MAG: T9SS type A sorting domain-containing protein [Flavobacteriales bacterium]|nr:MAG: T9SS type A sorting domain-containing protein [Flavobacteriales bacterium]
MRSLQLLSLVCVLHGPAAWWTRATAQGFNARYDTITAGWEQVGFAIEENAQGELLVISAGPRVDSLYASSTVQIVRLAADGTLLSADRNHVPTGAAYPGSGNTSDVLPDGRIAIGGSTLNADTVARVAVYWFDQWGAALTYVEHTFPGDWIGNELKCTPDGGYIVVGGTYTGNGTLDVFLLKLDSAANVQWVQTYGGSQWNDFAATVDLAPGGGYYMGGVVGLGNNSYEPWILRLDSMGGTIWSDTTGSPLNDRGRADLTALADGRFVYGSGRPNGVFSNHWPQLVKVDSTGTILWDKIYDVPSYLSFLVSVKEITPGGDLIAAGESHITNTVDGIMLRTTAQGDSIWMRHYVYYDSLMTDGTGRFYDVIPTSDGGFAACGAAYGSASGNNPPGLTQDVWVVKVDSLGCIEPGCHLITGVQSHVTNLQGALVAWPNPVAHGTTATVHVALPEALATSTLRLAVSNAQGQLVLEQSAVQGNNVLDTSRLSAGLYHVHLANATTWLAACKVVVE